MEKIIYESVFGNTKIQVIDKKNVRHLRFNNVVIQSSMNIKSPLKLQIKYTRMMVGILEKGVKNASILVLGMGASSIPNYLYHKLPYSKIDVVEVIPDLEHISRTYFNLPKDNRMNVIIGDALNYVKTTDKKYDLIFVDIFGPNGVPKQFRTEAFYQYLNDITNVDGNVAFNTWVNSDSYRESYYAKLDNVFDEFNVVSTASFGNDIVFCKK